MVCTNLEIIYKVKDNLDRLCNRLQEELKDLSRGNRIDFVGVVRLGGLGIKGIRWKGREEEYREKQVELGAFQGWGENLLQGKLHDMYQGDPSKNS